MFARRSLIVAIALVGLASAAAGPDRSRPRAVPHRVDDIDAPTLGAAAIERALTPYVGGVRACYVRTVTSRRATGHLQLEVLISGAGDVERLVVTAPGVEGRERARLDRCLGKETRAWHFPMRHGSTWASIPFHFQRTPARGAGPQPSCWSPRGCPGHGGKESS